MPRKTIYRHGIYILFIFIFSPFVVDPDFEPFDPFSDS